MPRVWARMTTPEGHKNGVGDRVRERRLALGLTQKALGGRIAVHSEGRWAPTEDELYGLEKRDRLVSDLEVRVLAGALECSVLYLMGGEDAASDDVSPQVPPTEEGVPRRRARKVSPNTGTAGDRSGPNAA
jgi:transcriptional regulator with XRE-family HTH domain